MSNLVDLFLSSRSPVIAAVAAGVLILTALVTLLTLVVFVHHLITDRNRRRNRERFEGASVLLAAQLVNPDGDLRTAVLDARRRFGARAVGLVLRRARYDIRGEAADRISRVLEETGAVDALRREALSKRDWKRAAAVKGLAECGGASAREALIVAAEDPSGEVRRAAREGLLADRSPEAIRVAIGSFLKDLPRRAGWRRSFYARLASVSASDLLEMVRNGSLEPAEQKLALEALGDAGAREVLPVAVSHATSPDPELRATAARVIGKVGSLSDVPLLISMADDVEWFVRAAAARAIEWMFSHRQFEVASLDVLRHSSDTLARRLTDSSWWVRANCARALARETQFGIPHLLDTAEGGDNYARDAALAALALAELPPPAVARMNAVVNRLRQHTPSVQPRPPQPQNLQLGGFLS